MRVLRFFAFAAVSAALCFGAGALSGRRAPGFSLPDSQLKQHDLADYRGKLVVLEIMQTRCPTCQKLAQALEQVKAKYGDKIAVLSVVVPPDTTATVSAFRSAYKVTSPILFDCGQMTGSYLKSSPANPQIHVPHLFLIDSNGMIRNDFAHDDTASFQADAISRAIDQVLAGPKPKAGR